MIRRCIELSGATLIRSSSCAAHSPSHHRHPPLMAASPSSRLHRGPVLGVWAPRAKPSNFHPSCCGGDGVASSRNSAQRRPASAAMAGSRGAREAAEQGARGQRQHCRRCPGGQQRGPPHWHSAGALKAPRSPSTSRAAAPRALEPGPLDAPQNAPRGHRLRGRQCSSGALEQRMRVAGRCVPRCWLCFRLCCLGACPRRAGPGRILQQHP
mmetsp:Transcript_56713/g.122082  ORF Transcript_56713/g.122082 Transcript_56713/m.122082 type:complete len:211 (+) Transcript_56713:46-678(+)